MITDMTQPEDDRIAEAYNKSLYDRTPMQTGVQRFMEELAARNLRIVDADTVAVPAGVLKMVVEALRRADAGFGLEKKALAALRDIEGGA